MRAKSDVTSEIKFLIREGPKPPEQDCRPQPKNFEFVHGKDRESRTRVRRHVMQGWRRNKKQQFDSDVQRTRGQWASKESAPQEADTPGASSGESPPQLVSYGTGCSRSSFEDSDVDWDFADRRFPTWQSESFCVPEPEGSEYEQGKSGSALGSISAGWRADSYGCISSRMDNREDSAGKNTMHDLRDTSFGSRLLCDSNPSQDPAFTEAPEDPSSFQEIHLFSSAHYHDDQRNQAFTPEFLHYKLSAIRHMNLALSDPTHSTSDEMIENALYIASVEICPLDLLEQPSQSSTARIHLSGIRRMIQLRNSYEPSYFTPRLEAQLLGTECLIPTPRDSILFAPSSSITPPSTDTESLAESLIDFFTDLSCLSSSMLITRNTSQHHPLIPQDTLLHALLSTPASSLPPCSAHNHHFSQLASLFYLCVVALNYHSSRSETRSFFTAIESQLQAYLYSTSAALTTPSPHILLYILLSSPRIDALPCGPHSRGWHVARLMYVAKCVAHERRARWTDEMWEFLTEQCLGSREDGATCGVDVQGVKGEIEREFGTW